MALLVMAVPVDARADQSPGPEPGSPEQMDYFADTCRKELERPPTLWGEVENVATPGPGPVVAGDVIDVTLSWNPADWNDTWVEKVLNCVSIDGAPAPELTAEERPAPNDGVYERQLVIPEDIAEGRLVCQQGFVFGMFSRGGYTRTSSPRVCFTTQAAPPPPPPSTTTTTAPPTTTTTVAAPAPTAAPAPEPVRVPAAAPAPAPVAAPAPLRALPRTGPGGRSLLVGAGGTLAVGGLALAGGARHRRRLAG